MSKLVEVASINPDDLTPDKEISMGKDMNTIANALGYEAYHRLEDGYYVLMEVIEEGSNE